MSEDLLTLTTELARHPLLCRPGTSDLNVFHQVFVEREYADLDDLDGVRTILDCGANVGYSAAYLLSRFPGARLIALEPDPGNFALLRANLAPYGDAARARRAAVWSHAGGLALQTARYRDGYEWTRQVRECMPGEEPEVVAVDVAGILREVPGGRLSILKMDVEGAEGVVFGAPARGWIDRVDSIAVELHDDSIFGNCSSVFFAAIAGRGFEVTRRGDLTICRRR